MEEKQTVKKTKAVTIEVKEVQTPAIEVIDYKALYEAEKAKADKLALDLRREVSGLVDIMPDFLKLAENVNPAYFDSRLHENATLSVLYQLGLLVSEYATQVKERMENFPKSSLITIVPKKRKLKENVEKVTYDDENKPETKAVFIRRLVAAGKSDENIIQEGVALGIKQRNVTWYRAHP